MLSFLMDSSTRVSLKQSNRKIILDWFRKSNVLSVSDVSSKTGISKPTVQKVINHFVDSGYILPEGKGQSTDEGGKKPLLYSFNRLSGYTVCIHLGPDFLYSAISDMSSEILHSEFRQLDNESAAEVVGICAEFISRFSASELVPGSPMTSIAIALPGLVNPDDGSLIFTPHFPEWGNDYPFIKELRRRIPITVPVYCDNINRYQAFAEMEFGRATGKKNFLIIDAMKEGLGSGIVVNGKIKHGAHNFSGEIGHMILMPEDGPPCICGGRGCFEALVNLKSINYMVSEGRGVNEGSRLFLEEEMPLLGRLSAAFEAGDSFAASILDRLAFWFASGINNVIMVNDPELIILEGIYNDIGDRFIELIRYHLERLAYPGVTRSVDIEFSSFGRERGIIGAGAFAADIFFRQPEFYS